MIELLGNTIYFQYPFLLLLGLLIPIGLIVFYINKKQGQSFLNIGALPNKDLVTSDTSILVILRKVIHPLLLLGFLFLTIAIARPQLRNTEEIITNEGIDMVISIDISGSMLAEDFQPNRMEAAKDKALEFVNSRKSDRIGLVIFAGESFTLSPVTSDKVSLAHQIMNLRSGMLEDGTAIGMGLATAVDRLRASDAESKVVILLTDGVNNTGRIDPITALELAKAFDIKVYTVGIGTIGEALFPVPTSQGVRKEMRPVEIDEALMKRIANETGGQYFRAVDNKSLEEIYAAIDELEKTEIESVEFQNNKDLFYYPLLIAFLLFSGALLINWIISPSLTDD